MNIFLILKSQSSTSFSFSLGSCQILSHYSNDGIYSFTNQSTAHYSNLLLLCSTTASLIGTDVQYFQLVYISTFHIFPFQLSIVTEINLLPAYFGLMISAFSADLTSLSLLHRKTKTTGIKSFHRRIDSSVTKCVQFTFHLIFRVIIMLNKFVCL